MILNSEEALKMLNNARGKTSHDGWIDHSICVGNTAGRIAKELNLDEDFAKSLGYIHDIGKKFEYEEDGVFAKTHYHIEETMKLKEYFDNRLGHNLYDLFPEIKDNL